MSAAVFVRLGAFGAVVGAAACGSGSAWVSEPLFAGSGDVETEEPREESVLGPEGGGPAASRAAKPGAEGTAAAALRAEPPQAGAEPGLSEVPQGKAPDELAGRVLGVFRNTYYDFPTEAEHRGEAVPLMSAQCEAIAQVPLGFHDAVCVQGSGVLSKGLTVSFARRDCECARTCPRTGQRICFEALDPSTFPWGRGALGKAITPLLTVAVDDSLIPMNTPIYVPEYDGVPRDASEASLHDGCFLAQDRGMKVKGKHLDIFTGDSPTTRLWNRLVPSNSGVTVVLESPRCARSDVTLSVPPGERARRKR